MTSSLRLWAASLSKSTSSRRWKAPSPSSWTRTGFLNRSPRSRSTNPLIRATDCSSCAFVAGGCLAGSLAAWPSPVRVATNVAASRAPATKRPTTASHRRRRGGRSQPSSSGGRPGGGGYAAGRAPGGGGGTGRATGGTGGGESDMAGSTVAVPTREGRATYPHREREGRSARSELPPEAHHAQVL